MVNPQKERGYVGLANEIWDEIIRRDFTKRQKDILQLLIRLSYGCQQKTAYIPKQQDFTLCGLGGKGHVGEELKHLEACRAIIRHRDTNEFELNKNYDMWQISPVRGWDEERYKELIHLNIIHAKKKGKAVTEMGTCNDEESYQNGDFSEPEKFLKQEPESYQIGNKNSLKKLPKQELESSQNGNHEENEKLPKQEPGVTKTGTSDEKKLLKQELEVTETGTEIACEAIQDKGSGAPKKGLKKVIIKKEKDLKTVYVEIIAYLNEKTGKKFSPKTKSTIESINGRMSEGFTVTNFKHVIDVKTAEWLNDPKMNQYLCPTTLFRPSHFEKYLNQIMPHWQTGKGGIPEALRDHQPEAQEQSEPDDELNQLLAQMQASREKQP